MKKTISFLLAAAICIGLCACQTDTVKLQEPVNFYYRNAEVSYGTSQSLISPLPSESAGYEDTVALLNTYLKGPGSTAYDATFPASTKVLQINYVGSTAYLTMNDSLARYSGIDLTIACACLTLTVIELTGVTTVTISTSNESLDGASSITMTEESLILLDIYTPETTE